MIEPKKISGFSELLPQERIAENKLMDAIRAAYERSGFAPIETPAVERLEVLTSKGADDREIYALHRLSGEEEDAKLGLHFDLTVPLARYVAEHYSELDFPFRRYQIQKVWRGERAQAGRGREFVQADIDIIAEGTLPIFADVEVVAVVHAVFREIGLDGYAMRINNRKILKGFLAFIGLDETLAGQVIRLIDKVDKIGLSKIEQELSALVPNDQIIYSVLEYLKLRTLSNDEKFDYLAKVDHPMLQEGLSELRELYLRLRQLGVEERHLVIDPAIARGLDYYTGTIFETFVTGHESLGSICSGGRYEDLASHFVNRALPGVGASIGATRLFYVLTQIGHVAPAEKTPTKVLVTRLQDEYLDRYVDLLARLRAAGIPAELVLDGTQKIGKQIAYADRKKIPYALVAGEDELRAESLTIKKLATTETKTFPLGSDPKDWLF